MCSLPTYVVKRSQNFLKHQRAAGLRKFVGEKGKGGEWWGEGAQSSLYANLFPPLAMARLGQPHPHYAVITISLTERDFKERSNISADIFSILWRWQVIKSWDKNSNNKTSFWTSYLFHIQKLNEDIWKDTSWLWNLQKCCGTFTKTLRTARYDGKVTSWP